MSRDRVEIAGSRKKLVVLLALSIALTAACIWITVTGVGDASEQDRLLVALGIPFFGLCTFLAARWLMTAKKPVIVIDARGLLDRRVSRDPIPWLDIDEVSSWGHRGQRMIVIQVPPETEAAIGLTRTARLTRGMNATLGADGLIINPAGLTISYQELLDTIITRAREAIYADHS